MALQFLYCLVLILCIIPIIPGILGVIIAAFSYIPSLGMQHFSWQGFYDVFTWPGVSEAIKLTSYSAFISTYLAALISFAILQASWHKPFWRKIEVTLSPLLAIPHVAFAIGFAFTLAPTGMIARLSFHLFNYDPNAQGLQSVTLLIKDAHAIGLILMLTLKEIPFLLLMSIPVLQQLKIQETQQVCSSLGYSHAQTWWKCILPQWLNKLRFPLFAVMAYSLSVVDVSLIIGPTSPSTFSVLVWQWFNEANLQYFPRAAAGALTLLGMMLIAIGTMRFIEWMVCCKFQQWQYAGRASIQLPGRYLFSLLAWFTLALFPLMGIWSLAQRWRFPDLLPSSWSLRFWHSEWPQILPTISQTLIIALISATIALILAIIAHEYRIKHQRHLPTIFIALPMLLPQLSLLFGMQITQLLFNSSNYLLWVIWAHLFFAFPYIYLTLDGPWRSFNSQYMQAGSNLGKTPLYCWLKIKLPLLLPAITLAWAVGFSISFAQYLSTLMLGGGRINTITTEAIALASGFDRRITAIYALWQALLPLAFFALAFIINRLQIKYRNLNSRSKLHLDQHSNDKTSPSKEY